MIHRLLTLFVRWLSRLLGLQPPRTKPQRTPWTDTSDPSIGWTYQVYDGSGALLYVGSSKHHPFARLADHSTKYWWPKYDPVHIRLTKWANYNEAHAAEILEIQSLNPLHNKVRYVTVNHGAPGTPVHSYTVQINCAF